MREKNIDVTEMTENEAEKQKDVEVYMYMQMRSIYRQSIFVTVFVEQHN